MIPRSVVAASSHPDTPINLLLEWSENSDDVEGFAVERAPTPGGPWQQVGTAPSKDPSFLDRSLQRSTAYYYRVRAFNSNGYSAFSNVAKAATPPAARAPRFLSQPIRRTVSLGDDVTFSLFAAGNPPMQYQWLCNGTNIPGATNSTLTLKPVQARQAGIYALIVSNDVGTTRSLEAKLTVLAPLTFRTGTGGVITPFVSGQKLEIGRTYRITAVARAGYAFQGWRVNGTNVATSRTLFFVMQPGLEFGASFRDIMAPSLAVTSPRYGDTVKTRLISLSGTARDNSVVREVLYQINDGPWIRAKGTTNWQAQLLLRSGPNSVRILARDTTGNSTRTNTLVVTSLATNSIVVSPPTINEISVVGGTATISLASSAGVLYALEFKDSLDDSNWTPISSSLAPGNGGLLQLTDALVPVAVRYYRVRALADP